MAYTTINKSTDHFNTKLYTGTGNSNAQTGVGFKPDMVWLKNRGASSNHHLVDAIRGITKELRPNLNNAQADDNQLITALGTDGFTVGTSGSSNTNNNTYVAWNWKANGSGSSNTAGSINSTVSANTTSGFSMVSWQGNGSTATVGHGLGIAPELVFVKGYSAVAQWYTYAKHAIGNNGAVGRLVIGFLDNTAAFTNDTTSWQSTDPTSTLLYVNSGANQSMTNIAYCFSSVKGFSKMGSYKGNGNTDGVFVYTGFKPAWILFKETSAAGDQWHILDSKRNGFNLQNNILFPDSNGAEQTSGLPLDILSNGFKLRSSGSDVNGNGQTYIYAAFAEAPLVGSNNIPATAR